MQFKSLLGTYQPLRIDERKYSDVVFKRLKLINTFAQLRHENTSLATTTSVLGVSKATIYRYMKAYKAFGLKGLESKSKAPKTARKSCNRKFTTIIKDIRLKNPTWGKLKIHTILMRDHGEHTSMATRGRIISKLIATNKVKPAYFAANKNKHKRKRVFTKHAKAYNMVKKLKTQVRCYK